MTNGRSTIKINRQCIACFTVLLSRSGTLRTTPSTPRRRRIRYTGRSWRRRTLRRGSCGAEWGVLNAGTGFASRDCRRRTAVRSCQTYRPCIPSQDDRALESVGRTDDTHEKRPSDVSVAYFVTRHFVTFIVTAFVLYSDNSCNLLVSPML